MTILISFLRYIFKVITQIRNYLYFSNFTKKHYTYSLINGKLQITSTTHDDFVTAVQRKINQLAKTNSRTDFIKLALSESLTGCNFIIFSPAGEDCPYIQFWTGDHQLKFDFYANKTNHQTKYFYPLLGLLSETGFVNRNTPDYRGFKTYKVDKGKDYVSVDANLKKDIDSAATITAAIFKDIYKIKDKRLAAKVG
ncbi:MAG: hypothetical protein NTY75_00830 [Candidatus Shapirobacteria bacterium]|nr:hypothetical protein [Candidatus Shapirobacteria bacterium]